MAQSGQVAEAVSRVTGRPVELVEITTYGDISREQLAQIGGTGVFVDRTARRAAQGRGRLRGALAEGPADRRSPRIWSWRPYPRGRTRGT